jgi:hypothetical protein
VVILPGSAKVQRIAAGRLTAAMLPGVRFIHRDCIAITPDNSDRLLDLCSSLDANLVLHRSPIPVL